MQNRRRPSQGRPAASWLRSQLAQRPLPVWVLIVTDILLLGISLVVFALFHHVLRHPVESLGIVSNRSDAHGQFEEIYDVEEDDGGEIESAVDFSTATSSAIALDESATQAGTDGVPVETGADGASVETEAVSSAEAEASDAEDAGDVYDDSAQTAAGTMVGNYFSEQPGDFAEKFADKFTAGEVQASQSGYKSGNVSIELKRYDSNNVVFYVADIYVRDISCIKTAFAQDTYGKAYREHTLDICQRINGILAVNGDNYGSRDDGVVIRNGELYRKDNHPNQDVCVLYWDGRMETYAAGKFNTQQVMDNGAYQAWNFGPRLITSDGKAKKHFNSVVTPNNPRTALGYYEPGHYCFVVVDGRSDASGGLTLAELAALMRDLGCTRAYNMDGGNTSVMVGGGRVISNPSSSGGGGRETSDIIAIVDN